MAKGTKPAKTNRNQARRAPVSRGVVQAGRDAAAMRRANAVREHAALSEEAKTERLAHVIARAGIERGAVEVADCVAAGFSEPEAKRLFEPALAMARVLEPALDRAAGIGAV